MSTYALIPGAWHGAWCWARVAPLLTAAGHRVVAVDLPCEDATAGCAAYRDVVLDAIGGEDADLIVVGHSAGGLTAPLVARAAAQPVRRLAFVCALLPLPGRAFAEQNAAERILEQEYQAGVQTDDAGLRRWVDADVCARTMYAGCAPEDVAWAFGQLRPQASTMYTETSPLDVWPGDAPILDIRGDRDRLVSPAWAAQAVPRRLGVEPAVIAGSGHSPMLSHPRELAALLLAAA
ncbi:alpha/beta fold hydrolase [Conexibacter woesei]|uniref:Hydrolase, alpha/beta fold family protein n=1 Tax=Conexibacter woesei (strain DSM 14684 / CCUG 47730 / CIP 108061 / JCM 11494 / NBRC 100937 / ID131577) TaxID=469383 RepID=D3FF60_CONWI|nr:alpha/beta fold hydrolase [Conexibacter woesei]ADB51777.1 hydrolase, alpha/beta fold family protein [Conexibacter woesei DSM 14684]